MRTFRFPFPPGQHQSEACRAVLNELQSLDRTTVIQPCGTGKTYLAAMVAEALQPQVAVLFFPSISLIDQTLQFWRSIGALQSASALCVCSDETVADNDDVALTSSDLGVHISTSSEDIRQRLGAPGPWIIFCTYHSAPVLQSGLPPGMKPDLAIFDEAHRTASGQESAFSFPLSNLRMPVGKRLFLTATPRHAAVDQADHLTYTMDNPEIYGRQAYILPLREAVSRKIICDYQVLVSAVTTDDVAHALRKSTKGRKKHTLAKEAALALAISLHKAMDKTGAKKVFTFHRTVAAAAAFARDPDVQHELGCPVFHISGAMTTRQRQAVMAQFRAADRAILTNARCLTEGIDVPSVDMVCFSDAKESVVDIVQVVGRAQRNAPGKTFGYVLLPALVSLKDIEQGTGGGLSESRLRSIWMVLARLAEQESVIAYRSCSTKADVRQARSQRIDYEVIGNSEVAPSLRQAIEVYYSNKNFSAFDENFKVLKAYRDKTGSANPVASQLPELASWLRYLRYAYGRGELSRENIDRLEAIGFGWSGRESAWDAQYAKLLQGQGSARWISQQRSDFRSGKLSPNRQQKLAQAGFDFSPNFGKPVTKQYPPSSGPSAFDLAWNQHFCQKSFNGEEAVIARAMGIPVPALANSRLLFLLDHLLDLALRSKTYPFTPAARAAVEALPATQISLWTFVSRLQVPGRPGAGHVGHLAPMNGLLEATSDQVPALPPQHQTFPFDHFDQRRPLAQTMKEIAAQVQTASPTRIQFGSTALETWLVALAMVANAVADDLNVGLAAGSSERSRIAKKARLWRLAVQLPNGNWLCHDSASTLIHAKRQIKGRNNQGKRGGSTINGTPLCECRVEKSAAIP